MFRDVTKLRTPYTLQTNEKKSTKTKKIDTLLVT